MRLLLRLRFGWKIPNERKRKKRCSFSLGASVVSCSPLETVRFCALDSWLLLFLPSLYRSRDDADIIWIQPEDLSRDSTQEVCLLFSSVLFGSRIDPFSSGGSCELYRLTKQTEMWFPAFLVLILLGFLAPVCYQWKHKLVPRLLLFLAGVLQHVQTWKPFSPLSRILTVSEIFIDGQLLSWLIG